MRYFPAFFDLKDKPVLIAGGGELALRKARLLAKASPDLVFMSASFEPALLEEFGASARFIERSFDPVDLALMPVVMIVATGDGMIDEMIAETARVQGIPVNVVDRPELCDFVVPSIVERDDVVVGISTGGAAPVLGRTLRARIEALLPRRLGALAGFAKSFRETVAAKVAPECRKAFWENFFTGPLSDLVLAGRESEAREKMLTLVNREPEPVTGFVHIVGAGPGDPELLTLKALRVLQDADIVLYDNLVGKEILDLVRRDAERLYVGKKKSDHTLPQEEIGALMIRLAGEGRKVVRLKGGDPFIFGRGGEELDALAQAGVAAEVVPGITAATGCAASASVPLTHRDHAQAVTFVTGHARNGAAPDLDWQALTRLGHTLVVYMGVGTAAQIAGNLQAAGMSAAMPVAIIEKGTLPAQKIIRTTLGSLPADIGNAAIEGPAVLVIGEVAAKASGRGLMDLTEPERLRA